jgi:hypothetical protein
LSHHFLPVIDECAWFGLGKVRYCGGGRDRDFALLDVVDKLGSAAI